MESTVLQYFQKLMQKGKEPMTRETAELILDNAQSSVPNIVVKVSKKIEQLDPGSDREMGELKRFLQTAVKLILEKHKGFGQFGFFSNALKALRGMESTWRGIINRVNPKFKYTQGYTPKAPEPSDFDADLFYLHILSLLKKPLYIASKYVRARAYENKELYKTQYAKIINFLFRQVKNKIKKFTLAYKATGHTVSSKRKKGGKTPMIPPPAAQHGAVKGTQMPPPRPSARGG